MEKMEENGRKWKKMEKILVKMQEKYIYNTWRRDWWPEQIPEGYYLKLKKNIYWTLVPGLACTNLDLDGGAWP
jgi:hypothetical protein